MRRTPRRWRLGARHRRARSDHAARHRGRFLIAVTRGRRRGAECRADRQLGARERGDGDRDDHRIRLPRVERDRRRRGDRLVHVRLDRHPDRRSRPAQEAGRSRDHARLGQPVRVRQHRARRHGRRLAAAARAARPRPGPRQPDVRPAAGRHQRPLRRAHRVQRHRRRRLRGRVPRLRARPGRVRPGPGGRPVLHPAGTRRGRDLHRPGPPGHPGDDHARGGRELRADAAVGGPAARLQRPRQRPRARPAGERVRDEDLPRHHVLRLLGRPDQAEHPGRVGGRGPRAS